MFLGVIGMTLAIGENCTDFDGSKDSLIVSLSSVNDGASYVGNKFLLGLPPSPLSTELLRDNPWLPGALSAWKLDLVCFNMLEGE